ncbi:MAG: tRNA uridine-5-carboxymethylaminomethyl(34) synthesis GTPase MnmE [Rhizobiaceae bacterium]
MKSAETIFALSSGRLPCGVAVIRVSGGLTRSILEKSLGFAPEPRVMRYAPFRNANGDILDRCLNVFFPGPDNFTGEDSAEFHLHGSIAVVRAVSAFLESFDGVRHGLPGEFAKRAFLNGKLDLAEAEGLGDLIAAETESQLRLAHLQADGTLSSIYGEWRGELVQCRAMIEAAIDFSDEDDVASSAMSGVLAKAHALSITMETCLGRSAGAEIIRDGLRVVILGAPNAGKSSLLNALAGRDVAIATEEAGTTRDLIDLRLDLGGSLAIFTDTAGIRDGAGIVESIGIERALGRAANADVVLLLEDLSNPIKLDVETSAPHILRVGNKMDLLDSVSGNYDYSISAQSGAGLEALLDGIRSIAESFSKNGEILVVQQRQKALIASCLRELDFVKGSVSDLEIAAEHLRRATDCIGQLTGDVDVEELLEVIFSRFCIGK